ncbi:MAG TPA: hypothetical protein VJ838_05280 [Gaiellaceae bacterium]|nr:hypothetical protein [Gaiellaceae bacterium]
MTGTFPAARRVDTRFALPPPETTHHGRAGADCGPLRRVRIEAAPLDSVPGTDEPLGAILLVAGERAD